MAAKKGLKNFQNAFIKAALNDMVPSIESRKGKLEEVMKNYLLELDGPRRLEASTDPREVHFSKVFYGFLEITKSLETLDDIAFYIRRFPFTASKIDPARYLQFHIEAHLSEIYLLRERLIAYVTLMARTFKRDPMLPEFRNVADRLVAGIDASLKNVIAIRGTHVHVGRFSDDGIDRLGTMALLARAKDDEMAKVFKELHRVELRKVRKKWQKSISDNNKALRELVDRYFDALYPIVFHENGSSLRYSSGARPARRQHGRLLH
jgi:hypothetical protein